VHTNVCEVELLKSFPWLVALDFAKLRNSCLRKESSFHFELTLISSQPGYEKFRWLK